MKKDLFAKTPEFLAAFSHILENGFFDNVNFEASALKGELFSCSIRVAGYVSTGKKRVSSGVGVLVNPQDVLEKIRSLAESKRVKSVFVETKTENWPRYDRAGENVIGSKGTRTDLFLRATFKK